MKDLRKTIGNSGEQKSCDYLLNHGFSIVERNYRTKDGEIDIIAKTGEILVFVEVKTLPSGNAETLLKELDTRKQKRIIKTSICFLTKYRQYSSNYIRYDVIVIDMPGYPEVYHIENAFSELL